MRYRELLEARPWKRYHGRRHKVLMARNTDIDKPDRDVIECPAYFGQIVTGKQQVFQGHYVSIVLPNGDQLIGEHPRWLYDALQRVCDAAEQEGWTVLAVGRTPRFRETGLSANSGYGVHPDIPDRHVHMSEPLPDEKKA